jgi:hypothetical protein
VATELGENKLVQLRAARRAGLLIPRQLVSQDPARIRSFCAAHPGAIIKPVRVRGDLAITAVASAELLAQDEVLALSPAIYQENIPGHCHLRITVRRSLLCRADRGARARLAGRRDRAVHAVRAERGAPAGPAGRAAFARPGDGIFDLKLTPEGELVFFEVNPQGQFLFVEGLCEMPIARSLGDYLVEEAWHRAEHRIAAVKLGRHRPRLTAVG